MHSDNKYKTKKRLNKSESNINSDEQDSTLSQTKRIYTKKMIEEIKRWTKEECDLYGKFIEMYYDVMIDKMNKRSTKVFRLMSEYLVTKTPSQC